MTGKKDFIWLCVWNPAILTSLFDWHNMHTQSTHFNCFYMLPIVYILLQYCVSNGKKDFIWLCVWNPAILTSLFHWHNMHTQSTHFNCFYMLPIVYILLQYCVSNGKKDFIWLCVWNPAILTSLFHWHNMHTQSTHFNCFYIVVLSSCIREYDIIKSIISRSNQVEWTDYLCMDR